MRLNNIDEYELLELLLDNCKSIVIDRKDNKRQFLQRMCDLGFITHYDEMFDKKYYHVNNKFKKKILEIVGKN